MSQNVDADDMQYALYFYDKKQRNENSTYHHNYGALQLYRQNLNQARNEYKKSIEVNPRNIGARNDLAVLHYKSGEINEAEKHLTTALGYDSNQPILNKNLSATLARTGRYKEAVTLAKRAIELNPNDAASHRNLAKIYDTTGDSRSSLEHNLEAIKTASLNSSSYTSNRTRSLESNAYRSAAGVYHSL